MTCAVHLGARLPCMHCAAWHEDARTSPLTRAASKVKVAAGKRVGRTSSLRGPAYRIAAPRDASIRGADGRFR